MPTRLPGRVVAITGAGRGIGAATAAALAAEGARVAMGDIDLDTAEATASAIGGEAIAIRLDVTDQGSFAAFLNEAEERLGPLDVLVNNAGIMPLAALVDEADEITDRVLDINVRAVIRGTREAARRMRARGRGHIVNVASTAGKAGLPGGSTYCASKSAVITFSEAVSLELRETGIEVSCVMPGIVRTELATGVPDLPGFHSITPESVAEAIVAAVVQPRFEVYVPASAGRVLFWSRLMPRRAGEWLARRMRADRVFLDAAQSPDRVGYEARAAGGTPSRDGDA